MQKENVTIKEITEEVESASTNFELTNNDLKIKYLLWNIQAFNIIARRVHSCVGTFGTGYPFYALDKDFNGPLPIITEQIRYNRELVKDGKQVAESIWQCKDCLRRNYWMMPDLKKVCKPCPNILNSLKPRKIINRLPDMDMWMICQDGKLKEAEEEMKKLLEF